MSNPDQPNGKMSNLEMEMALDQQEAIMPLFARKVAIEGKMLRSKFDGLLAAGFTEQQALHITATRPLYE